MYRLIFLFYFFLFSAGFADSEDSLRKIAAHLLIGYPKGAKVEAEKALRLYPDSPQIFEMAIKSLAACGDLEKMMQVWKDYKANFPEECLKRELIEEMCWGILKKGQESRALITQLISLIGAALTQDMHAVDFLLKGLNHSNAQIREVSIELASLYGDYPLKKELIRLFREERVQDVRIEVMKAIGRLKIKELFNDLVELVSSKKRGDLEKYAAVRALANMQECLERQELETLIHHPRAALRLMACEVIAKFELKEQVDLVEALLHDTHPDVQVAALHTLGVLQAPLQDDIKILAREALNPIVGITASWVWLLAEPEEATEAMKRFLFHKETKIRSIAAAAVSSSGPFGMALAKEMLELSSDPYVRANLALALVAQREEIAMASQILDNFLFMCPEKIMWKEEGPFRVLQKSTLFHKPGILNYPQVTDQTTRLEILNLLAILEYPKAEEAIKKFLKERTYGVTGLAAETLLGEGDETAIEIVKELLSDPDKDVRFEAALVLATWGRDASSLPTLIEIYPEAPHELKIKILEALAQVATKEEIPFLIERLEEPSLVLKMIAASVLIQAMNR